MLVLTRKSHESVVVGDSSRIEDVLKVTVLEIKGDKVRLGFEADKDIPVNRCEVWQRICNERAGRCDPSARREWPRQLADILS